MKLAKQEIWRNDEVVLRLGGADPLSPLAPPCLHPDVLAALAGSRIHLLPLPTYATWTNPAEKVWLGLYREVLHQHPFQDDWLILQQTVQAWLDQFREGSLDLLHGIGLYPY